MSKPVASPVVGLSKPPSRPWSQKTVLPVVATVLLLVCLGLVAVSRTGEPFADPSEKVTPAVMKKLEQNRAILEKSGLKAGNIYIRDWGAIDNDGVTVNGALTYTLAAGYQVFASAKGSLQLRAIEGASGCSTIEVRDDSAAIYQLCLRNGDPITTFTR